MFSVIRKGASLQSRASAFSRGQRPCVRRRASAESGAALLELALTMPILMLMLTGIFSLGLLLQQDMQLTDAVNIGAKYLAIERGQTTDPCNLVATQVIKSAPYLNPANMSFSFVFDGQPYSGTTCSSATTTSGAAFYLQQGQPIKVTVTYPCSIAIYGQSVVPSCLITTTLTEIEQ